MTELAVAIRAMKDKCKNVYNLEPDEIPKTTRKLSNTNFHQKLADCNELLANNNSVKKEILDKLNGIPYLVAITDNDGYILKSHTDSTMKEKVMSMGITEGVQFRSEDVGINSVSMSLSHQRSVLINGNEHYHHCLQQMSCFSTPIRINSSKVGTLSIMTTKEKMNNDILQYLHSYARKAEKIEMTNKFYQDYYFDVLRYLIYLSKNKEVAQDLCQKTFIDVFNGVDTFKQENAAKSWIYPHSLQ